jgi:hypothetical protein
MANCTTNDKTGKTAPENLGIYLGVTPSSDIEGVRLICNTEGGQQILMKTVARITKPGHLGCFRRLFQRMRR